jgi:hypothetical protein
MLIIGEEGLVKNEMLKIEFDYFVRDSSVSVV